MGYLCACACRELLRRRARTVVNVLGYVLATATMIVLVTLLIGSRDATGRILGSTGTHFIAFAPARAAEPLDGECVSFIAAGVPADLLPDAIVDEVKGLPTVRDAAPYLLFRIKDPDTRRTVTVGGFDPRNNLAVGTTCCAAGDVLSGRFLWPGDKGKALLEEAYAVSAHLRDGDTITIAGRTFPIIGVINPGIRPGKADVYVHIDDARQLIATCAGGRTIGNQVNVVLVEVASSKVQDEAIEAVRKLRPGLVVSSYACYKPASKVMGMDEATVWLLTVLIGVCAVAWAMKSQLSSIIERRREIGILKAIGWTDRDVVALMLAESVLQALAGGVLGCAAACALVLASPFTARPWLFVAALLLALFGGVTAGSLPALSAARVRPADGLRSI